ncbi:MAG: hypothetical protein JOZ62_10640 [Acidobacteriaceae bacterium]|nr:hypothetical protein [Acidobacteriaceae bacterium]
MRKRIVEPKSEPETSIHWPWLNLEEIADVEVTSEDSAHPVENVFLPNGAGGWKASTTGPQIIRLRFVAPETVTRIHLQFSEKASERMQEFVLHYADESNPGLREIVRQQWTFSPQGSTIEVEDYQVNLQNVTMLQLTIDPDRGRNTSLATLDRFWLA